jgi:ketosteroid isomerase-like protein
MSRSAARRAQPPSSAEAAEAAFYEALQHGDVDAVMQVWGDDDDIVCVHPGGPRLVGAAAIRASFEQLLAGGALAIHAERVLRNVTLGCAVHNVVERVQVQGEPGARGDPQFVCVLATNVYVKTPDGWRLALHHASPGTLHEAVEVLGAPERLH